MEPRDFRPHPMQRRFYEGGARPIGSGLHMIGGRTGKRRALELHIIASAADLEQAQLAIEDLYAKGIALLDGDGNRVEPNNGRARFTYCRFDEEKK